MAKEVMLDCRGLACPQPVVRTQEALQGGGDVLVVVVDDEGSCTNVRRFAESRGHAVEVERRGPDFRLTIRKAGGGAPLESAGTRSTVVLVASEGVGRGDEDLGRILMAAFLDTLAQFAGEISHLVLWNAGARLAVQGSPVLDQIRALEQTGVEVLVCGTCLNHFGIKDRLAAGSVSNMYAILETLLGAGRILSP